MRYLVTTFFLFFFFAVFTLQAQEFRSVDDIDQPGPLLIDDRMIIFENINLVPMTDDQIQYGMDVRIREDRIMEIAPHGEMNIPSGAGVIDGTDHYLMPGLAEMHGHVPPPESTQFPERYIDDVLFLYLAGGVTTVRGMLGYENQLYLKESVNQSEILGPNLYLAGPSFSGGSINSPEEAVERVHRQVDEGWDLLKVHPGLSLDQYTAMAEAANEAGIAFAGHVPEDVGLENAIRLGQQTIDHLDGYIAYMDAEQQPVTDEQLQEAVDLTVENDVWVVPTQALWETLIGAADAGQLRSYDELKYMPENIVQNWYNFLEEGITNTPFYSAENAAQHAENRQKLLKALQDGGAKILLGTDAPQLFSVPGLSIPHELAIMEDAGMTPYEILVSGTYNVGKYFEDKDQFGTLTENSRADLLMISGNPLEDLSVIKDHLGVMVRGIWLPREQIDEKLDEIEQAYERR